jgi:hypothetical protein
MIALNQQFTIVETGEVITISDIQYIKVVDGKKQQMKDPVCTISYESEKKPFTTYSTEVNRLLQFGRWKKI